MLLPCAVYVSFFHYENPTAPRLRGPEKKPQSSPRLAAPLSADKSKRYMLLRSMHASLAQKALNPKPHKLRVALVGQGGQATWHALHFSDHFLQKGDGGGGGRFGASEKKRGLND